MKVAVFGLGFVGLTTAVGLANVAGAEVCGYEIDAAKAENLARYQIPFFESGLEEALRFALDSGKLRVTNSAKTALEGAKIIFYCIGTPMAEDGAANLDFLLAALKTTAQHIKNCAPKPILVIKSTTPPSSLRDVFVPFLANLGLKNGRDCIVANNPEFLREGYAYSDFVKPDRVVIGSDFDVAELVGLYAPFAAPIILTSPTSAEFVKYLSNCLLSSLISYANEMSMAALAIGGIDIKRAFEILHLDKRLAGAGIAGYIYPGLGFGGYCLPKDTLALAKKSRDFGFAPRLIDAVLGVNEEILRFHLERLKKESRSARIGILGLSFKPESDDVRDSKSAALIAGLLAAGFENLHAYDPLANAIFAATYDFVGLGYENSAAAVVEKCEILVIATAWEEFRGLEKIAKGKKIYNLRWM